MDLGSTQAIKSAVEVGLGISIVSRLTVERDLEQKKYREINIKNTCITSFYSSLKENVDLTKR